MKALGLELYSPDDDGAAVLTAALTPEGVDAVELRLALRDRFGITIAGGHGDIVDRLFRIGHIGYVDVFDIVPRAGGDRDPARRARHRPGSRSGSRRRAPGVRGRGPRLTMRVLIREPIADAGVELLRARFDVDRRRRLRLAEIIGRYDGIVIRSATKLTAELIARAERLKVIGRAGVGVDNVDVDAATRRGIVVANAPESTVISAAEQTVGLMVALARNIPQAHAALKQGRWERSRWSGIELDGKTLGVIGFGRIGQQVARRAIGLGMRVIAVDPFVGDERFRELGVEQAGSLDEVLAAADVVTLHSPLTDETRGLIGRDAIAKMKDGARLDQRGPRAVSSTRRRWWRRSARASSPARRSTSSRSEPYSGPLLELDEVVVTPHLAASTDEAQDRAGVIVAEQVVAALDGGHRLERRQHPGRRPGRPRGARARSSRSRRSSGASRVELAGGARARIAVAAHGPLSDYDTRLLTVAALNGAFQGRVDHVVNVVNAPLLAAERGIAVAEERFRASRDYTNLVEVRVGVDGEEVDRLGDDDRTRAAAVPRRRARLSRSTSSSRSTWSSSATTTCPA